MERLIFRCLMVAMLALAAGCGDYSGSADSGDGSQDEADDGAQSPGAGGGDEPGGSDNDDDTEDTGGETPDADSGGDAGNDLVNGKSLYASQCQSCHGASGQGGVGPSLTSASSCPSCASFDTLWVRIRDTMPSSNPSSCDEACGRDVAAYIMNGFSTESPDGGGGGSGGGGSDPDEPGSPDTPDEPDDPDAPDEPDDPDQPDMPDEPEPPAATCSVEFSYQSVWNTGFVADVTIRNFSGADIDGWAVEFTFPNNQLITNDWNTVLSQSGAAVRALPESYNSAIANNGSTSFGFQGTHDGISELPQDVRLDAPGCTTTAPPDGGGDTGGGEDEPVACGEVPAAPRLLRLLTRWEYERTVHDLTGLSGNFAENFPTEARIQGYDNNAKVALVTDRHVDEYIAAAEDIGERAVAERKSALLGCDPDADSNCARSFVEGFGRLAFRRPLTTQERDQYLELFDSSLSATFDEGMSLAVAAFLSSPQFLYRSETGVDIGNGRYRLGDYEIASSLSYLLWGSLPDEDLLQAAASGALREAEGRLAQTERMLADPRARERFADFATQWLGTGYLLGSFKDPEIFPGLTDEVRRAMVEELSRFVNHVAFDSTDGTLDELYSADYVFVNGPLRQYYGLPGSSTDANFVQQPADATRGGILGLGAVLASHAHSNESSPIKRGVFVRERLLCQDLPDPPPDVDTTPPGLDPTLTTRDRFAQHTSDPNCAACHQYIDGTGFGLERYDGAGGYRTTENGLTIDDSGELVDREGFNTGTSDAFSGPLQLAEIVRQTEAARACVVQQYYRYSHGYVETGSDECALEEQLAEFADDGYSLRSLLINTVAADEYILRRAGGNE